MVSTNIWEKRISVNNHINFETYKHVLDKKARDIDSETEEENSEDGEWRMIRKKKIQLRESV